MNDDHSPEVPLAVLSNNADTLWVWVVELADGSVMPIGCDLADDALNLVHTAMIARTESQAMNFWRPFAQKEADASGRTVTLRRYGLVDASVLELPPRRN